MHSTISRPGIYLTLTAMLLLSAPPTRADPAEEKADDKADAELSDPRANLIRLTRQELATREAAVELAKARLAAMREKLKTQEAFINDLNAAIANKQEQMAEQAEGAGEDGDRVALPASFLADVTPRIVIIEGDKGNGTGFLCTSGGELWVYTAAHVLSGNSTITVRDSSGRVYRDFDFLESAEGVDLVRLKPKGSDLRGLELVTRTDAPEVGDVIVAVGNSLGAGSLSGEPGRILSIEENMWEVDAEIIPGNSGGPVLSLESGKVVGIVTHLIISKYRNEGKPETETQVKRFAARLDKEWEWRKMPVSRFVKEWQHIETMERESSIAWASIYLMLTGPEAQAKRDSRYRVNVQTDPKLVSLAESILAKDRENFQVQRVGAWLKRFRESTPLQHNTLIAEGNKIIEQNLEEIRLKDNAPKPEDFSWYHRQMFEIEIDWRKRLTTKDKE